MELIERNEQVINMMDTCIQNLWESTGTGNKELISCIKKLNLVYRSGAGISEAGSGRAGGYYTDPDEESDDRI